MTIREDEAGHAKEPGSTRNDAAHQATKNAAENQRALPEPPPLLQHFPRNDNLLNFIRSLENPVDP